MFNYFNPYRIFKINSTLQKVIFICFILVLSIGLVEALFLSPQDYLQEDSVRIRKISQNLGIPIEGKSDEQLLKELEAMGKISIDSEP